jgi:Ala-tRNA(Pro) deacylase
MGVVPHRRDVSRHRKIHDTLPLCRQQSTIAQKNIGIAQRALSQGEMPGRRRGYSPGCGEYAIILRRHIERSVMEPSSVFDRVASLLKQQGIAFQVLRHAPVYTSEEAARVRGTPLSSGAKALICKGDETFVLFVLPADRKLASHSARRARGWRKLRFATREEVLELSGLAPGSIPPFGSLFGLPTLCDQRLGENEVINFNAGDHGISVSMRYADWVQAEKAELGVFAE